MFYMLAQAFLDHLKNTQEQKNSSLKKITQNSSKKLKVSVNMKKEQLKLTQIKGKIHHLGYNKVKKLLKSIVNNSPFLRGN